MSLFDNVSLGISTKYGAVSLAGGRIGVSMAGDSLQRPEPTPLTPARPPPGSTGPLAWVRANPKTAAAIAVGAVLAIVLLRR